MDLRREVLANYTSGMGSEFLAGEFGGMDQGDLVMAVHRLHIVRIPQQQQPRPASIGSELRNNNRAQDWTRRRVEWYLPVPQYSGIGRNSPTTDHRNLNHGAMHREEVIASVARSMNTRLNIMMWSAWKFGAEFLEGPEMWCSSA